MTVLSRLKMEFPMHDAQDLFGSALAEIAAGPKVTGFHGMTAALMRRPAEKGLTLEQLADRRIMKRSIATLQAHCREFEIAFPDYVPMALRHKVEFVLRGDFYELTGVEAIGVAAKLDIVVTQRRDSAEPMCAIPAHAFDAARAQLGRLYIVKVAKAKRGPRRLVEHA